MITIVRILRGQRPNAARLGHQVACMDNCRCASRSPHVPNHGPAPLALLPMSSPGAGLSGLSWNRQQVMLPGGVELHSWSSYDSYCHTYTSLGLRASASNHGMGLSTCVSWYGAWLCTASFDPPAPVDRMGMWRARPIVRPSKTGLPSTSMFLPPLTAWCPDDSTDRGPSMEWLLMDYSATT